jgi:hypothetical protein
MKFTLFLLVISTYSYAFDRCLTNVKDQFERLSPIGVDTPIKVKKGVFEPKSYTHRLLNKVGIDNHFQGIQKLPGINNYVLTGSDIGRKGGDLVIINNAEIIKRVDLGKWPYWHPGGIQIHENILAVPVEEYKKSEVAKIYFFDFSDVTNPRKLPIIIDIPKTKAGAVLFHRLQDDRYLIGSYNMTRIDFYFSNTKNLLDGFEKQSRFSLDRRKFDLGGSQPFEFGAQSVNFIPQCDGKLFMVFFENTGKATPLFSKDDRGLLFSLDFNAKKNPVSLISVKTFKCLKSCNFAAAAGIHIDNEGKLFIYSSPHYLSLKQNHYNIREFNEKVRP